ncbi:MAG: LysR family transcriptional regulator [Microbacteriaceae bacterium]
MDYLEVRDLNYFVVVAEELHFGRAAETLHLAQPALSKAVQRLEKRLGVELFARTSRSVALTPAGEALLEHGRHALNAIDAAARAARRASETASLRLAMKPGGDGGALSALLEGYAQHPGARQVDILFHPGAERASLVREGLADAALLYTPFEDTAGLTTITIHKEGRIALLPSHHRFASRASVDTAELDGEMFAQWSFDRSETTGAHTVTSVTELMPLVRLGRVIAVLPRSFAGAPAEGVAYVPVADASPSAIVIGCRANDTREAVRGLMNAALALR